MSYSALYLPYMEDNSKDPSQFGFATEEEAEIYIVSRLCKACKKELRKHSSMSSLGTSCGAEWLIVNEDLLPDDRDATLDDVFTAAGMRAIYTREENTTDG